MNADRYPTTPSTPCPIVPSTTSTAFIHSVHLKFLTNDDIGDLKDLCADWFPIKYPDAWYKDVTNGSQFFSLAAVSELNPCSSDELQLDIMTLSDIRSCMIFSDVPDYVRYCQICPVVNSFRRTKFEDVLINVSSTMNRAS